MDDPLRLSDPDRKTLARLGARLQKYAPNAAESWSAALQRHPRLGALLADEEVEAALRPALALWVEQVLAPEDDLEHTTRVLSEAFQTLAVRPSEVPGLFLPFRQFVLGLLVVEDLRLRDAVRFLSALNKRLTAQIALALRCIEKPAGSE